MEWLGANDIPFAIVFTKLDKLTFAQSKQNIESYKAKLLEQWEELPPIFTTSSQTRAGRDEILGWIENINKLL